MENNRKDLDFDVLGYTIKLKHDDESSLSPHEIIEYVRQKAEKIQQSSPNLDRGQTAILVALGLAVEKMTLENDFKDRLDTLHSSAADALSFIEEVSPTVS